MRHNVSRVFYNKVTVQTILQGVVRGHWHARVTRYDESLRKGSWDISVRV